MCVVVPVLAVEAVQRGRHVAPTKELVFIGMEKLLAGAFGSHRHRCSSSVGPCAVVGHA